MEYKANMRCRNSAFRAIAKAKKDGVPLPSQARPAKASTDKAMLKDKGKQRASEPEDNGDEEMAGTEAEPIGAESEPEGLLDAESDNEEDEESVTKLVDDRDGADESPIEDDEVEEEEEEDEDEEDEAEEAEEPQNPDDFEEEMGRGLDGKRAPKAGDGEIMDADDT